jgi:hypothetical protein
VGFSVVIFVLLGSEDGFSTAWKHDAEGHRRAPALYNALFSTIAFLLGAITSIVSGFLGGSPFFSRLCCVLPMNSSNSIVRCHGSMELPVLVAALQA